jgi:hypothetical protein
LRKIKPIEVVSPSKSVESESEQEKKDKHEESDMKQAIDPLSFPVTEVREFKQAIPLSFPVTEVREFKQAIPLSFPVTEVREFKQAIPLSFPVTEVKEFKQAIPLSFPVTEVREFNQAIPLSFPVTEVREFKQAIPLSFPVTEVKEFNVPNINETFHISLDTSGRLWASDDDGNLVQTDMYGNQLQKMQTSGGAVYHTATQDEELIFIDKDNKRIKKITLDNKMNMITKTGGWKPLSIHSSHINGDILVGMRKAREAKVTWYDKTGKELQNIQRDSKRGELFSDPRYITENINSDICVSDRYAVVVVYRYGEHKFSYVGQESVFCPCGICTDIRGHILVCDDISNTVHILDQDGQLLSLLTEQHGVQNPWCLCVDDSNIYVGQYNNNTVKVYKYLQ